MEQKQDRCPICENHCTKGAEQCERGQSYFQGDGGDMHGHHHGYGHGPHHGEHHGPHHGSHGRFGDQPPMDGLSGLFVQCGHHMFHYCHERRDNGDELFASLSDTERTELEGILKKLLADWQKRK